MATLIDRDELYKALSQWDWQDLYLPVHFKEMADELPAVDGGYTEQDVRDSYNDGFSMGVQRGYENAVLHYAKLALKQWIPVSERPPEDLEEVNITFTNLEPEPYYDFIKGKRFTGSAVFYKGEWYWYSSVTVDVLKEYGRYESEKIDDGIKIIAWQSLPEPYKEEE